MRDHGVAADYPGAVTCEVEALPIADPDRPYTQTLTAFEASGVAVSTGYVPIDLGRRRLILNQTYETVFGLWNPRPRIEGGSYTFRCEAPAPVTGKTVVFGGPIEGNYYHWMTTWLSRLMILQRLRPDLYADPRVALLIDVRAASPPFIAYLEAAGLDRARLVWADMRNDYLLDDAVLVSLGSETCVLPDILRRISRTFGGAAPPARRGRRLWISRQRLGPSRRRVANMDEIAPVLASHGFEDVVLEGRPLAEQIALFREAESVAGVHGAGLTNIVFADAACRLLVVESDFNLKRIVPGFYKALARAGGQPYAHLKAKRAPLAEGLERTVANAHNQDLIVSPNALDAALAALS